MKKYQTERVYNYWKQTYKNYILLVKSKKLFVTYKQDARIICKMLKIPFQECIYIDKNILEELIVLKEEYRLNIAVCGWKKRKEYYSLKSNEYENVKRRVKNEARVIQNTSKYKKTCSGSQ